MVERKLARNPGAVIAAEMVKQQYDELVAAGFTETQALKYLAMLIAEITTKIRNEKKQ